MSSPLTIFEDNQGCISYGTLSANQSSMRHLALKYHWVRQEIKRKTISLQRVPSANNIADIFTKALAKPKFQEFRRRLNIVPVSNPQL